jgi:hypothetical protein
VIKVDTNRDLYTRHGLHLNSKGKELITNKVVAGIKDVLHGNKKQQEEKGIMVMNQVHVVEQGAISSVRNCKINKTQEDVVSDDKASNTAAPSIHINLKSLGVQPSNKGELDINSINGRDTSSVELNSSVYSNDGKNQHENNKPHQVGEFKQCES